MSDNEAINIVLGMIGELIRASKPGHNNIMSSDFSNYAMLLDAQNIVGDLLVDETIIMIEGDE